MPIGGGRGSIAAGLRLAGSRSLVTSRPVPLPIREMIAPVSNPTRPLDGTLDLRTGAFRADLTTSEPTARARLEGTFGAAPALTGTHRSGLGDEHRHSRERELQLRSGGPALIGA